jgi:glutathione S-transferase
MELYFTPRSPYVRKVRAVLIELDLWDRVTFHQMDLESPDPALIRNNPLGKVPTLVTDGGQIIFDSRVICEYLDGLVGNKLFPSKGPQRWTALRRMALSDGILEALQLRRQETSRPEAQQSAKVITKQKSKSDRGLLTLEDEADEFSDALTIGHVAIGCCLGYLDFRFKHEPWRETHPKLAKWYESFSARRSMTETMPPSGEH